MAQAWARTIHTVFNTWLHTVKNRLNAGHAEHVFKTSVYVLLSHLTKDLQGALRLLALLACAYQGVVGDDVRYYVLLLHLIEDLQGALRLLALLACADQGVVGDDVRYYALLLHLIEDLRGALQLLAFLNV